MRLPKQLLTKEQLAFQLGFMSHGQVYNHPYNTKQQELIQSWITGWTMADSVKQKK